MKTQIIETSDIQTVLSLIPNGQIFTVTFTKKAGKSEAFGETRVMNCRKGVKAHLSQNPLKKERAAGPANLVNVYDMKVGFYRQFNIETTSTIKALGQTFVVANA